MSADLVSLVNSFDIANHFNEYAGGTDDGHPDYSKFPSEGETKIHIFKFCRRLSAALSLILRTLFGRTFKFVVPCCF